jgi:hypothetical protein
MSHRTETSRRPAAGLPEVAATCWSPELRDRLPGLAKPRDRIADAVERDVSAGCPP